MNDDLIELSVDFKYENGSRNVLSGGNIAEGGKHSYIDCRITLCDCFLILQLPVLIAVYQILLF